MVDPSGTFSVSGLSEGLARAGQRVSEASKQAAFEADKSNVGPLADGFEVAPDDGEHVGPYADQYALPPDESSTGWGEAETDDERSSAEESGNDGAGGAPPESGAGGAPWDASEREGGQRGRAGTAATPLTPPAGEHESRIALDLFSSAGGVVGKVLSGLSYLAEARIAGEQPASLEPDSIPAMLPPFGKLVQADRLPRTSGKWEGTEGESNWRSTNPDVNDVTKGQPIKFRNQRPDFRPWSKGRLVFKPGQLNGTKKNDFKLVYERLASTLKLSSSTAAKNWLKRKGLTPHHRTQTTIDLVPSKLHNNIPHTGSAADMRRLFK